MELYDISCIPQSTRAAFTTFISELWATAPAELTAWDLVNMSKFLYKPYALGQHYWIADPLDPSSGQINPKWDFRSTSLTNVANPETAYLVGNRTGIVPAPTDSVHSAEWVTLAPLIVEGKPDGLLADQVFRINTNGGNAPNGSVSLDSLLACSLLDVVTDILSFRFSVYLGHLRFMSSRR